MSIPSFHSARVRLIRWGGADDPNFQYLYTYWLWEVQDFEEEDDVAESQFSIGTIVYYGPDDKVTTKIVAGRLTLNVTSAPIPDLGSPSPLAQGEWSAALG